MALRDVVRNHMHDTTTFVFASGGAAKRIQTDLTEKAFPVKKDAGRPMLAVDAKTLPRHPLPKSWLLVVLVNDENDVETVASWAKEKDLSRILLCFAPGTDTYIGMRRWAERNLPTPGDVAHFRAVPGFRRDVGIRINERINLDFG